MVYANELLRHINNLFCSCFDLLYFILFILTFWLGNLYQQIVLEILITLVYFFVRNFIKLVKKIQKIEKILNIIYQSYEDSIYFEHVTGISLPMVTFV